MKHASVLFVVLAFVLVTSLLAENANGETSWYEDGFGKELVNAHGSAVPSDSLDGKLVALYFSAHWCPPCRAFTPKLVQFYNELKSQEKSFELVFVSFDRKAEDMSKYMTDMNMPWLAIPYQSEKRISTIKKFQVRQIPTLIVLNSKGQIITTSGYEEVEENGTKAYDTWATAKITAADTWYEQYFGKQLTDVHKDTITADILRGKIVGVYHSASWCGPCRNFTPELVKFYDKLKKQHVKFEIVLLDEDQTKEKMTAYMKEDKMQWLAMPFDNMQIRKTWQKVVDVADVNWGIPTLVIFGPDGRVISNNGRREVVEQGDAAFKLWSDKWKELSEPKEVKK